MKNYLNGLFSLLKVWIKNPQVFIQTIKTVPYICKSFEFSQKYQNNSFKNTNISTIETKNPLWEYFQNHKEGLGVWKWEHYFDIYHRHFAKFIDKKVDILEVGIYSGGSLEMWRSYFGEQSHIYGVDIEKTCEVYANDYTSVFIGDQADRNFWQHFRNSVEGIDILIDDGGHTPEQQQITLEEMLQHIRPGGVYLCEDVHGAFNKFSAFATGLINDLNNAVFIQDALLSSEVTSFQSAVYSIHFYPYVVVIEKHINAPLKLSAPKHGTQWQPWC